MGAAKPENDVLELGKSAGEGHLLDAAFHEVRISNFCVYFCNVNELKNKRYILLPMKVGITLQQHYAKTADVIFLETNADGLVEKVIVECSVRDMLMINKIAQDNIQVLMDYTKKPEPKKPESS